MRKSIKINIKKDCMPDIADSLCTIQQTQGKRESFRRYISVRATSIMGKLLCDTLIGRDALQINTVQQSSFKSKTNQVTSF